MRKFIQHPWYSGLVRIVVHEEYYTLVVEDHGREGWPVVDAHWDFGWFVGELYEASAFDEWHILRHRFVVTIFEQYGDDIIGMLGYPIIDCAKIVRDRTSVQYVAGSMAEMGSAIHEMHLPL